MLMVMVMVTVTVTVYRSESLESLSRPGTSSLELFS
jgi:hypothetical protein